MWVPNEVYMASIYIRNDSRDITKYYGSINHNNLRIHKYLDLTKNQNKSWIIYTEREAGRQGLRIENNIYKLHNIKNIQITITI